MLWGLTVRQELCILTNGGGRCWHTGLLGLLTLVALVSVLNHDEGTSSIICDEYILTRTEMPEDALLLFYLKSA